MSKFRKTLCCHLVALFALAMFAAPGAQAAGPVPAYNWSGLYVGIVGTYGWADARHCEVGLAPECLSDGPFTDMRGWMGGATLGYNWQFANWVVGIEGDASFGKLKGRSDNTMNFGCSGGVGCSNEIKSYQTLRGRLGYAFDRFLPFVTAGAAWSRLHAQLGTVVSDTKTISRFVVGGGLEYAVWQNVSLKLEYLHISKLGDFTYDDGSACGIGAECFVRVGAINEVRLGLNWHFGNF